MGIPEPKGRTGLTFSRYVASLPNACHSGWPFVRVWKQNVKILDNVLKKYRFE